MMVAMMMMLDADDHDQCSTGNEKDEKNENVRISSQNYKNDESCTSTEEK